MDKTYLKLFAEIAHVVELTAEQVLQLEDESEKKRRAAEVMREDYCTLKEILSQKNFNPINLTRADYAKILVGVLIIGKNLEQEVTAKSKVLNSYKNDLIPKLERIVNESTTNKEARQLASDLLNPDFEKDTEK